METFKFFKGQTGGILVQSSVRTLRAEWSRELAEDIQSFHNLDVAEELNKILSDEIAREIDNEIMGLLFPTVQRITAQTIGNDLVSVQPLSVPSGNLFYMDFKYNKLTFKFFRG